MTKTFDLNHPLAVSGLRASAFCGDGFRRSDGMRTSILTGNAMSMMRVIRESVDRTFGEIASEAKTESGQETIKSIS